jgi:LCP family protein required for cell wall assembly
LWAKLLVILGAVLFVVPLGLIVTEKVLTARYSSAVHRSDLLAPNSRSGADGTQLTSLHGPLNYLLIGSDARAKNPGMGARSDTIIIVHVPATLDRAYMISIPRDLRVDIPPDPDRNFGGGFGKINASFQYGGDGNGGVRLLSATLTKLTGIHFDGAAVVDFGGFDKVVKELGGVHMCIDEQVRSIHTGHLFTVGCQNLTPQQTLDYLRQRETLKNGDFDRQRHQQQFLKAIFQKTFANGLAQNPIKLDQVIRAVGSSLTVDTNGVPLDQLVFTLRNINPSSLVGVRVPSSTQTIAGVSYVVTQDRAQSLFDSVYNDTLARWATNNPTWVNAL